MIFIMKTDSSRVEAMCREYNLCTEMNCAEYEEMLNKIDGCTFNMYDVEDMKAYKYAVEKTAKLIYSYSSDSDISLEDIASMLFNRCTLRWAE